MTNKLNGNKCTCRQFLLKLTCFINLYTTSCSRCGEPGKQTLEQNVSDVYTIVLSVLYDLAIVSSVLYVLAIVLSVLYALAIVLSVPYILVIVSSVIIISPVGIFKLFFATKDPGGSVN